MDIGKKTLLLPVGNYKGSVALLEDIPPQVADLVLLCKLEGEKSNQIAVTYGTPQESDTVVLIPIGGDKHNVIAIKGAILLSISGYGLTEYDIPIEDLEVFISGALESSTQTSELGYYEFTNVHKTRSYTVYVAPYIEESRIPGREWITDSYVFTPLLSSQTNKNFKLQSTGTITTGYTIFDAWDHYSGNCLRDNKAQTSISGDALAWTYSNKYRQANYDTYTVYDAITLLYGVFSTPAYYDGYVYFLTRNGFSYYLNSVDVGTRETEVIATIPIGYSVNYEPGMDLTATASGIFITGRGYYSGYSQSCFAALFDYEGNNEWVTPLWVQQWGDGAYALYSSIAIPCFVDGVLYCYAWQDYRSATKCESTTPMSMLNRVTTEGAKSNLGWTASKSCVTSVGACSYNEGLFLNVTWDYIKDGIQHGFRMISIADGEELWNSALIQGEPAHDGEDIFVRRNNKLEKLSRIDGTTVWTGEISIDVQPVISPSGDIFVADSSHVYRYSSSGEVLDTFSCLENPNYLAPIESGRLMAVCANCIRFFDY